MAKARKLSKEFRQLLLFDRAPIDPRIPPFLAALQQPGGKPGAEPANKSNHPAAAVANFSAAGFSSESVSQLIATTPDARVLISPDAALPRAPTSAPSTTATARTTAPRSSGFIRRNRSKKPIAAPSLDFLCGTDGEEILDDDENAESSSCYVALERMIDRQAKAKDKGAGPRGNSAAIDNPYDRSEDFDDEDPDGLRLQLSPEQLARMEEVHRSWKPKQAKKRNMNYRPPMGIVEVEDIDDSPRKKKWSDE